MATLAVEIAAAAGLVLAFARRRALTVAALALAGVVALAIAWIRPVTPFYMTYALLPALAAVGALGLHALGARFGGPATAVTVGIVLALHVATVGGIARSIGSGHVAVPVVSRLDVKQDDPSTAPAEPWLAAWAVDASGALLCAQSGPVVLHGTYAYLEDVYLGLDHRLRCGERDVRLTGALPADATHLAGLALPLWAALGWQPPTRLGGLGVAPVASVLGPERGFAIPDGSAYPPHRIAAGPDAKRTLEASVPRDHALVVSLPYALWMPAPTLRVTAGGRLASPLARDAVSAVYACRDCPAGAPVTWRVEIDSVAPDRVDVVTLAPPG
jgi:hypothetical protein